MTGGLMGRRGNNEGSITRRKDGLWQAAISLGYDDDQKLIRKYFYGKTRAAVAEKLNNALGNNKKPAPKDRTLNYYINQFLTAKKNSVVNNTYVSYEIFANHARELGKTLIQELTREDVQEWVSKKAKKLKPASLRRAYMVLAAACRLAVEDEVISKSPCNKIELPQIKEKPIHILTIDEMKQILLACANSYVYDVVYLEYATGLRRSEVLGLTWEDVDFANNTISVNKSWIIVSGKPQWSEAGTKTESGNRVIAILPETADWLKRIEKNTIYIFQSRSNLPVNPQNFYKQYKKLITNAGLGHLTFHDLRHNYASKLMANDVHTSLIQGQLGQKDTKTTKRYMHAVLSARQKAVEKLRNDIPLL
jgi:integrase